MVQEFVDMKQGVPVLACDIVEDPVIETHVKVAVLFGGKQDGNTPWRSTGLNEPLLMCGLTCGSLASGSLGDISL